MREAWIIVRREFVERVKTRAFILSTFLSPLLIVAVIAIPVLVEKASTLERRLALVDEAPAPIGERFVELLTARNDEEDANRYHIEKVEGTFEEQRATLNERSLAEEIDGYIVLPAGVVADNQILYRARNVGAERVVRDIQYAASQAVQTERLAREGLQHADVASLMRRVEIDDASITETGEGRGAQATFMFAYLLAFMIYMMTALYGVGVLRSVLEEKTQRIAEVMVSSVKSSHLMLGKIIGVGGAALLQVGIWAAMLAVFLASSETLEARMGIPPGALAALHVPPGQAALFAVYFVLGFLLFAALFAATGAAISSEQEAQALQFPVMIPLLLPLLLSMHITGDPHSTLSTILGLFPLSAPLAMPMRITAAHVAPLEIAASIVLLVLGLFAVAWFGGKVFRIGILFSGKRPSMGELVRWMREA